MEQIIEVHHASVEISVDFEEFTQRLERSLGRFDASLYEDVETSPETARQRLEKAAGVEGLMLFDVCDHGRLLNVVGAPRQAKQYLIGNPLIAVTMTRHDIRAALYAPLRVLVYGTGDGTTRVEYDLPSSLFGQFDNPGVTAVAKTLDLKLANLIRLAAQSREAVAAW